MAEQKRADRTKLQPAKAKAGAATPAVKAVDGPAPLAALGGYFKGAWQELKVVRWPNRRNTWGLTFAVLGFTAFFIVLILLVDALFQFIFQQVILK